MNRNKVSIPLTSVTPLAIVMPGGVDIKREVKYREFNKLRNLALPPHDVTSSPGVRITEGQGNFGSSWTIWNYSASSGGGNLVGKCLVEQDMRFFRRNQGPPRNPLPSRRRSAIESPRLP